VGRKRLTPLGEVEVILVLPALGGGGGGCGVETDWAGV
jgi:hypothetical protein